MKKVFRQSLFLIVARFVFLLVTGGMFFVVGINCLFLLPYDPVRMILPTIVAIAVLIIDLFVVNPYAWPIAWGIIIVTPTHVIWRCLFYKSVKIALTDVKLIQKRVFLENCVKNTNPQFLFITDGQLVPYERVDKIKTKPGFIKFFYIEEAEKHIRRAVNEAQGI